MATPVKKIDAENPLSSQTILQRVAKADKTAVTDCLNAYGSFVWRVVRNQNFTPEESEKIVQDVFSDIWQFAGRYDSMKFSEDDFILMLIRHRLRRGKLH